MSFLVGTASGALVAGGVYYGFSAMMSSRTGQHQSDMHNLSQRLVNAAADIPTPVPAAQRIPQKPFMAMIQQKWNSQIDALFRGTRDLDQQVEIGDGEHCMEEMPAGNPSNVSPPPTL